MELTKKLSYANVVATLALVIAVAGIPTAVAVTNKVGKNAVTTKSIKNGSVTAKDLAPIRLVTAGLGTSVPTATCASGERLLGGGAKAGRPASDPRLPALEESRPSDDTTSWLSSAATGTSSYALCLTKKPGK